MARLLLALALLVLFGWPNPASIVRATTTTCQSAERADPSRHSAPVRKKYYYAPVYRAEPPRRRVHAYRNYHRTTGPYHPRMYRRQAPTMDEADLHVDEDDGIEISDDDGIEISDDDGIGIEDDDAPDADNRR